MNCRISHALLLFVSWSFRIVTAKYGAIKIKGKIYSVKISIPEIIGLSLSPSRCSRKKLNVAIAHAKIKIPRKKSQKLLSTGSSFEIEIVLLKPTNHRIRNHLDLRRSLV